MERTDRVNANIFRSLAAVKVGETFHADDKSPMAGAKMARLPFALKEYENVNRRGWVRVKSMNKMDSMSGSEK